MGPQPAYHAGPNRDRPVAGAGPGNRVMMPIERRFERHVYYVGMQSPRTARHANVAKCARWTGIAILTVAVRFELRLPVDIEAFP